MKNEIGKRIFYRMVPPSSFSSLDFKTYEEALNALVNFGGIIDKNLEHFEFWQSVRKQCYIEKVTEITEKLF